MASPKDSQINLTPNKIPPLKKPVKQKYPEIVETKSGDLDEELHGVQLKGGLIYRNAKENHRKVSTSTASTKSNYSKTKSQPQYIGLINTSALRQQL